MRKTIQILISTLKLAVQELYKNKLRTFLSLFGVTIGIFCIIGVLSTVSSLEQNIQDGVKSLGTNTVYIDKWDYQGGADYPWWKYVNRPTPKMLESEILREKVGANINVVFNFSTQSFVEYENNNIDVNFRLCMTRLIVVRHFGSLLLSVWPGGTRTSGQLNCCSNCSLLIFLHHITITCSLHRRSMWTNCLYQQHQHTSLT